MIAFCLGSAPSVADDLHAARLIVGNRPSVVIAANYAAIHYAGRIDALCSFHHELMFEFQRERYRKGYNDDYRSFSHRAGNTFERVKTKLNASSGLFAAEIAIQVYGAKAILCGIPLDGKGGHIHHTGNFNYEQYQRGLWDAKRDKMPIRSMSGLSRSILGEPDHEWLDIV